VGLDILKFEQTSLFYIASYLNSAGDWSFVSEWLSPSNTPHGYETVWQNFGLQTRNCQLFASYETMTTIIHA